jgi:putative membrane protein
MHYGGWNDGNGWWMGLMMIAVFAVAIWLIMLALQRRTSSEPSGPVANSTAGRPTPQEILAERLARGEIEPEQYSESLAALRSDTKAIATTDAPHGPAAR